MDKQTEMHIPGPWTMQPIGDETECNILGPRRELIATVADNEARLIAAAPEMLATLKEAGMVLAEKLARLGASDPTVSPTYRRIQAAITSATA